MHITDLCGIPFDMERRNCYTLVRDFYRLNYSIELPDYACPTEWWKYDLDLFRNMAHDEGFRLVDEPPSLYQTGDVLLMALGSSVGNHLGIIVPGNRILHHMIGQMSSVTQYGGMFRNNTVAVYRHPGVIVPQTEKSVSLAEVLPPHARRKLEDLIARQGSAQPT